MKFFIFVFLALVGNNALAEQYQINFIQDFNQVENVQANVKWLTPIPTFINNEMFVAQQNGQIFLAQNKAQTKPQVILNIANQLASQNFKALTALTVHPGFGYNDRDGFATFFTAHTAVFAADKVKNRIALINPDKTIDFAFETIITAWQYDFEQQRVLPQSQREVLRIPIKSDQHAISQLSFDPYKKPWNREYGYLYFSLNYAETLESLPLYSGALLRIHPMQFGMRNYTVPKNNPYTRDPLINDEIVIYGGQNIEQFFWSKSVHNAIFIQHHDEKTYQISKVKMGDELTTLDGSSILWQQTTPLPSILLYQGRKFLPLRNNMLFIEKNNEQWQLTSIQLEPAIRQEPVIQNLVVPEFLPNQSKLSLFADERSEIMFFESHQLGLYALQLVAGITSESVDLLTSEAQLQTDNRIFKMIVTLLPLLIVALIFLKIINNKKAKRVSVKGFTRLEYVPISQSIFLFKANQSTSKKILKLEQIVRCEILLNDQVIKIIDQNLDNIFSNQYEEDLRALFSKEHLKPITDNANRQLSVMLVDDKQSYNICLYLRKGNDRLTGATYSMVTDTIIDLCWVMSRRMQPEATEMRIMPSIDQFNNNKSNVEFSNPESSEWESADLTNSADPKPDAKKPGAIASQESSALQGAEVVQSLDKLVELHQQGYLTDEEFALAKNKLLQS